MAQGSSLFRGVSIFGWGIDGKTRAVQNHVVVLKPLER